MNINDLYLIVGYFSRELGSGMYGPDRFNKYCLLVNFQYYKKYLGIPEEYQIGHPTSRIAWQMTNAVSDRIGTFLVPESPITRGANGFFAKPNDYVAFSSTRLRYTSTDGCNTIMVKKRIESVPDAQLTDRLESTLIPPTLRRPIISWNQFGWDINPQIIDTVLLSYLRTPATPFRAYNGQDVYDPTASTQFEFPDICSQDILMMLLKAGGIAVQDQQVIDYASQIINKGNP